MFELLPRQWTPALPLAALTQNPVAFELAGERLVAFKTPDNRWHALIDRCPHRGAALSLGTVNEEGQLQCRYHGWRFAGDGRCMRVPLNDVNERALARIRATALPTRELAGALWIYTGLEANQEPMLPPSLAGTPEQFGTYCQEWQGHWTRAAENFIDFAHAPYLHRDTIGVYTHDAAEGGVVARVEVDDTEFGFSTFSFLSKRSQGFQLDWYRPNLTCLHFGADADSKLHVFSIPISLNRTRVMTVRRLPHGQEAEQHAGAAGGADHPILDEDRMIVESQPGDVCTGDEEISVATDAPSIAFRRWYRDEVLRGRSDIGAHESRLPPAGQVTGAAGDRG